MENLTESCAEILVPCGKVAEYFNMPLSDDECIHVQKLNGLIGPVKLPQFGDVEVLTINPAFENFNLGIVSSLPQHLDSAGHPQWAWNGNGLCVIMELLRRQLLCVASANAVELHVNDICLSAPLREKIFPNGYVEPRFESAKFLQKMKFMDEHRKLLATEAKSASDSDDWRKLPIGSVTDLNSARASSLLRTVLDSHTGATPAPAESMRIGDAGGSGGANGAAS